MNELNFTLQNKDEEIVNSMSLIKTANRRLQQMRDDGWRDLMNDASSFWNRMKIKMPDMEDVYVKGRRRKDWQVNNLHHYQVDLFYTVIDMELQELNNRFNEVNTELLLYVACLSPRNSLNNFKWKIY